MKLIVFYITFIKANDNVKKYGGVFLKEKSVFSKRLSILLVILFSLGLFILVCTFCFLDDKTFIDNYFSEHKMTVEYIGTDLDIHGYEDEEKITKLNKHIYFYRWKDYDDIMIAAVYTDTWATSSQLIPDPYERIVLCNCKEELAKKIVIENNIGTIDLNEVSVSEVTPKIISLLGTLKKECKKYEFEGTPRLKITLKYNNNEEDFKFDDPGFVETGFTRFIEATLRAKRENSRLMAASPQKCRTPLYQADS